MDALLHNFWPHAAPHIALLAAADLSTVVQGIVGRDGGDVGVEGQTVHRERYIKSAFLIMHVKTWDSDMLHVFSMNDPTMQVRLAASGVERTLSGLTVKTSGPLQVLMDYMAPAPPKGTHRYIFTLWGQVRWYLVL